MKLRGSVPHTRYASSSGQLEVFESFLAAGDAACTTTSKSASFFDVAKNQWDAIKSRLFIHCVHLPSLSLRRREVLTTFGHFAQTINAVRIVVDVKLNIVYVAYERIFRITQPTDKASLHQSVIESYDSRTLKLRHWIDENESNQLKIMNNRSKSRVIVKVASISLTKSTVANLIDLQITDLSISLLFSTRLELTGSFEIVRGRTNVLAARRRSLYSERPWVLTFNRTSRTLLPSVLRVMPQIPGTTANGLAWNHYSPSAFSFTTQQGKDNGNVFRFIGLSERASNHEGTVYVGPAYLYTVRE